MLLHYNVIWEMDFTTTIYRKETLHITSGLWLVGKRARFNATFSRSYQE
jgi:hypothetical protein